MIAAAADALLGTCRAGAADVDLRVLGRASTAALPEADITAAGTGIVTNAADVIATREPPGVGTAAVLAAAYARWGTQLSRHLLGEFAGVIVDRRAGRVLLVQDSLGLRPLFYRPHGGDLSFSTRLPDLVTKPARPPLDLEYFADFMEAGGPCTRRTPFRGISRLIGGASATWRDGEPTVFHPWGPADALDAQPSDRRLLDLLAESVSVFKHARHPVWCDVSGGLDSTTVYSIARHAGIPVEPFSIVSRGVADGGDTDILDQLFPDGAAWHWLDGPAFPPFGDLPDVPGDEPGGETALGLRRAAWRLFERHGVGAVLSGLGGDQVFGSVDCLPHHLADLLYRRRFRALYRELGHWTSRHRERRPLTFWLAQYALRPLLLHARGQRITPPGTTPRVVSWVDPEFSRRFGLGHRWRHAPIPRHPEPGRSALWQDLYSLSALAASRRGHAFAADEHHPLFHRPLVELMLAAPPEERTRADRDRVLQRRALTGLLPDIVRNRRDKGTAQAGFDRSFRESRPWHRALTERPRAVDLGLFDAASWARAVDRAKFGLYESLPHFHASVCIEMWLRTSPATG